MIDAAERERFLRIYAQSRTIAVVGASADSSKAAHRIPRYLQRQGYRILPINPRGGELFGEHVFRSLTEIDVPVDVVEVFRPPQEATEIARQAIAIDAKVLTNYSGISASSGRSTSGACPLTKWPRPSNCWEPRSRRWCAVRWPKPVTLLTKR